MIRFPLRRRPIEQYPDPLSLPVFARTPRQRATEVAVVAHEQARQDAACARLATALGCPVAPGDVDVVGDRWSVSANAAEALLAAAATAPKRDPRSS